MPALASTSSSHPLARWRKVRWVSLAWVGRKIGQPAQNIYRWEAEGRIPDPTIREMIARVTEGAVPADVDFWERARAKIRRKRRPRQGGAAA